MRALPAGLRRGAAHYCLVVPARPVSQQKKITNHQTSHHSATPKLDTESHLGVYRTLNRQLLPSSHEVTPHHHFYVFGPWPRSGPSPAPSNSKRSEAFPSSGYVDSTDPASLGCSRASSGTSIQLFRCSILRTHYYRYTSSTV